MKKVDSNVIWQTLKQRHQPEKKYRNTWALIKLLIRIAILVWKVVSYFFDDGDSQS